MLALDLKLLRDLGRLWAQALAIALVIAGAVATLIMVVATPGLNAECSWISSTLVAQEDNARSGSRRHAATVQALETLLLLAESRRASAAA